MAEQEQQQQQEQQQPQLTDEQIVRQSIFGEQIQTPEVTPQAEEQPTEQPAEQPTEQPGQQPVNPEVQPSEQPAEQPSEQPTPVETPTDNLINLDNLTEQQTLDLINKRLSSNFENIDAFSQFFAKETDARNAKQVIEKLIEKYKESTNILSHFPDEDAYRVAQLAKDKYPGKQTVLSRVVGRDVAQLSDFDAIRLAQELKRPQGSSVDALKFRLVQLGLRDVVEEIADFDSWSEMDKMVVQGEAEDARVLLSQLGKDIEIPKEGANVDEFVSELQSGFAEADKAQQSKIDAIKPISEKLVESLKVIQPVEGDDFTYEVSLSDEDRKGLVDYLTAEALEGGYNLQSDADVKRLQGMLNSEIMATEFSKALTAYGKVREERAWAEAQKKYENAEPLNDDRPPVNPDDNQQPSDQDYAQEILRGKR